MEVLRGERFELRFPGTGWIYLGDEEGKEGLKFDTRRFEDAQAVFALNPEAIGEYLLRFQRQNPVDRSTEVSLVRVAVRDYVPAAPSSGAASKPAAAATATAPSARAATAAAAAAAPTPVAAPAAAAVAPAGTGTAAPATAVAPASAPSSVVPATSLAAVPALPDDPVAIIRLARAELDAKRTQSALEALDHYLSLYPYGNDELFYLYGLAYEQDTPFRNIKKAWENYRRVRDVYPRSARWATAAERVAYLEKHYYGLR